MIDFEGDFIYVLVFHSRLFFNRLADGQCNKRVEIAMDP